jgi:hypothetical protein
LRPCRPFWQMPPPLQSGHWRAATSVLVAPISAVRWTAMEPWDRSKADLWRLQSKSRFLR